MTSTIVVGSLPVTDDDYVPTDDTPGDDLPGDDGDDDNNNSNSNGESDSTLSPGAVAGITIAVVVGVVALVLGSW